jgi:uncharacterized membrane-anchored protein
MLTKLGGRKFVLSFLGVVAIAALSLFGADAAAYGSIALIVTAYAGANGYIEGRYAAKPPAHDADAP